MAWRSDAGIALSTGLVDERIYSLEKDHTPDLYLFFHHYQRHGRLALGSVRTWKPHMVNCGAQVRRWHGLSGAFGTRSGGGKRRAWANTAAVGPLTRTTLGPSDDPVIFWVADVDDASGRRIRSTIPQHTGNGGDGPCKLRR